ncbi:hypothetical protein SAMN05421688_2586 [Poseidonocella pacifica]|uniref:Flagellar motility protein MotE, a chaperone for MotC folding n=1 Tax=Poseidonocella pacifica TaxID=871651 RepID=A0A1I0XZ80_9RHOB|nr:hypothetical protein [Poseidonocella pacifica]SFB05313.1 hypothetical protein SAMN05421688_2586 [Poseidonocella pacifica]
MTLAVMLIGSAVLRLGGETGQAIALEFTKEPAQPEAPIALAECEPAADVAIVLEALQAREEQVALRESQVAARLQKLSEAKAEIEAKLASLTQAEARLAETITKAESASEGDIAQLTAVYENMKSKDAAALFETMSPDFAAGFLARMKPESAAGIMAGLSSEAAYSVSVVLAGRNANVPKQ